MNEGKPQLDAQFLVQEYENQVNILTKEMVYLRAMLRQAEAKLAEKEAQEDDTKNNTPQKTNTK